MTDNDIDIIKEALEILTNEGYYDVAGRLEYLLASSDRCSECGRSGLERDPWICLKCLLDSVQTPSGKG